MLNAFAIDGVVAGLTVAMPAEAPVINSHQWPGLYLALLALFQCDSNDSIARLRVHDPLYGEGQQPKLELTLGRTPLAGTVGL